MRRFTLLLRGFGAAGAAANAQAELEAADARNRQVALLAERVDRRVGRARDRLPRRAEPRVA